MSRLLSSFAVRHLSDMVVASDSTGGGRGSKL